MLMATFGLFWGSANMHVRQTVLAEGRQGVAN
jgi:hypothetical protein